MKRHAVSKLVRLHRWCWLASCFWLRSRLRRRSWRPARPPTQPARCAVHNFWRGRLVHRYRWILLAGDAQVAARLGSFDNSSDFSCSIRDKQNGSALVKSEAVARERWDALPDNAHLNVFATNCYGQGPRLASYSFTFDESGAVLLVSNRTRKVAAIIEAA